MILRRIPRPDMGEETVVFPSVETLCFAFPSPADDTTIYIRSEGMKPGPATPPISANFSHFKLAVLMSWMVAVVGKEVRDERS